MCYMNEDKVILHLCADIGSDSKPYKDAGYDVRLIGSDIGVENYHPPKGVYGIIANPPCTMFSIARSYAKTPRDLREGMRLVKECLRIIWECSYDLPSDHSRTIPLKFWAIENPGSGLLRNFLGRPAFEYNAWEYGHAFSKRTALWGNFNLPKRPILSYPIPINKSVNEVITTSTHRDPYERMNARSMCAPNFAKAFFEANP